MVMTRVVVIQSITQAVSILLLPRRGNLEILEELVRQFLDHGRRGLFAAQLFHFIMDALENISLGSDDLRGHHTAAAADDRKTFVAGL